MRKLPAKRNPIARALRTPLFRKRVVSDARRVPSLLRSLARSSAKAKFRKETD